MAEPSTKRLRCIIIGAGVSGILMGIKIKQAFGDYVEFQIFEKNEDVGGTWFENRYPGCACDVPSHIYQYSFCPNPYWSSFYASSAEIQSYLRAVVFHYGIDRHISFKSKIAGAEWDDQRDVWTVRVENKGQFECEILVNAGGILNNVAYPQLRNLDRFKGPVLHTAAWDGDVDLWGKRVAVVGAGASAIQCLPAIQAQVEHADIYIRTPSWISPPPGAAINPERNHVYTAEEIERFKTDAAYSVRVRKDMETAYNSMFRAFIKGSPEQQELRRRFAAYMKARIPEPHLQTKMIPTFDVGCRRINPGEAYLEALQQANVSAVFDAIDHVAEDGSGIVTAGGQLRPADVIIAATGFDTSFRPRFPIIGAGGRDLRELWKDDATAYCGLAVAGFPNYLLFLGPNTPISNGSLMGTLEATADFFIRIMTKVAAQRVRSFAVRPDVQADFDAHTQQLMQNMVWSGPCSSWYKSKSSGKILALWPGSSLHYRQVLDSNRWEDFEWKYDANRFAHWGDGLSHIERRPDPDPAPDTHEPKPKDLAYYIEPHANLPLEAYYLSSRGYSRQPMLPKPRVDSELASSPSPSSSSSSSSSSSVFPPRSDTDLSSEDTAGWNTVEAHLAGVAALGT
ncbi:hypothetical protein A1O3_01527 [Capronia epimyces CBS 606.96]|uniref:Cyclohexanone monooxygenase n=1 Tax=Capronia epimyces CBS 606.96 TaxID=1182542 RepID=W9YUP3_9EURO|nr:uncharacterized protein A1O3_01527 [Capronia epimyces CBS 606.96]EXJ92971.1 hypothetical protein A1O3_01527 [Capronia epimyces CBS 606.96]